MTSLDTIAQCLAKFAAPPKIEASWLDWSWWAIGILVVIILVVYLIGAILEYYRSQDDDQAQALPPLRTEPMARSPVVVSEVTREIFRVSSSLKEELRHLHVLMNGKPLPEIPEHKMLAALVEDMRDVGAIRQTVVATLDRLGASPPSDRDRLLLLVTQIPGLFEALRADREKHQWHLKDLERDIEALKKDKQDAIGRTDQASKYLSNMVGLLVKAPDDANPWTTAQSLFDECPETRELRFAMAAITPAWERMRQDQIVRNRQDVVEMLCIDAIFDGLMELRNGTPLGTGIDNLWGIGLSAGFNGTNWLHKLFRAEIILNGYFSQTAELQPLRYLICATSSVMRSLLFLTGRSVSRISIGATSPDGFGQLAPSQDFLRIPEIRSYQEKKHLNLVGKVIDVSTFGYWRSDEQPKPCKVILFNQAALEVAVSEARRSPSA